MLCNLFRPVKLFLCAVSLASLSHGIWAQPQPLELSRAARPWEFLCANGQRAGLFGNEAGNFEAWVYPLKLLRDFHIRFLIDGRSLPAEPLVRTVTARPESVSILYAGDTFSVNETWFVPMRDSGAVVRFEVHTEHPLEIEAALPHGAPDNIVRTVTENARTLKFKSQGFEEE